MANSTLVTSLLVGDNSGGGGGTTGMTSVHLVFNGSDTIYLYGDSTETPLTYTQIKNYIEDSTKYTFLTNGNYEFTDKYIYTKMSGQDHDAIGFFGETYLEGIPYLYRISINELNSVITDEIPLQKKLTAGTNITIDDNNVISASGSSAASWGSITGTLSNQTDLQTALNAKQDILTAGDNITIATDNTISSTIPSNVYTQDNLIGGTDIEIVEQVTPAVFDEYTTSCFHFDTNTDSALPVVSPVTISTMTGSVSTDYRKFGVGSLRAPNIVINNNSLSSQDFTVDFWLYFSGNTNYLTFYIGNQSIRSYDAGYFALGNEATGNYYVENFFNHWNHIAVVRKDMVYYVFLNGNKVATSGTSTTISTSVLNMYTGGQTTWWVDELRTSSTARWTDNFTPPTSQYPIEEKTGKTVVNLTLDTSELWTKSNLIQGTNIEIVPEPVEGGIDEYTLACWHLDENATDIVNSWQLKSDNSWPNVQIDTNNYKFGLGSGYGFARSGYYSSGYESSFAQNITSANLSTNSNITVDGWCYLENGKNLYFGFLGSSNSYKMGAIINRESDGTITITDIYSNATLCSGVSASNFFHVSWQFDGTNKTAQASINGTLYSAVSVAISTNFSLNYFGVYQDEVYGNQKLDELRISNTLRYSSNFNLPTQEYTEAVPTGNYVINNTQTATDLLTSISGYDATKTQVLKNVVGVLTWVDEV